MLMAHIYDFLGLTTGVINHDSAYLFDASAQEGPNKDPLRACSRQEAYRADITYGTNNEYGFDYLRDNMVWQLEDKVQRGHHFAIVDEVDSILIDEARTPLIISGRGQGTNANYEKFAQMVQAVEEGRALHRRREVQKLSPQRRGCGPRRRAAGHPEPLRHGKRGVGPSCFQRPARQRVLSQRRGVCDSRRRDRHRRRVYRPSDVWTSLFDGLHQAIEAKEGVKIRQEDQTLASITFQNYFKMYKKLAGMTGTAATEEREFREIYGVDVIVIPTHRPISRKDQAGYRLQRRRI